MKIIQAINKNTSLKINFIYNFSLNIINIIFPLITAPYISRVLGADNLGKYNFSLSFSSWFLIFAAFGTTTYGIREIAKVRNDKQLLNKTFTEIFLINFTATLVSFTVYVITIFINHRTNTEITLFLVSSLSLLFNLFCIDWLYIGLEYFKYITLRNLVIKLLSLISIFIFITKGNDYVIYALIGVIAIGITNIFNFFFSKNFVRLSFRSINIKKHIKAILVFFGSNIVVSMYTIFDQVLLGFFSTNKDVAFYSRSRQIYSIALTITLSISTVLLPKLAYLFKNDFESYKKLLGKSINYIYIFSVPSALGIAVLANDLMYFFGGREFEGAYISLIILSILVFNVSFGTWQYNQLFIPVEKEMVGLKIQIFMAILSVGTNLILIPRYGYIGASISLVFAEISGTMFAIYYAKNKIKEVKVTYITKSLLKYIFASMIMLFVILLFKFLNFGCMVNIIFGLFVGVPIYFGILYLIKDKLLIEFIYYFREKINCFSKNRKSQ